MAITVSPRSCARQVWIMNDKWVERIWQREGLKVALRQLKRSRLWLAHGSCIRLRPEHRNYVWSYQSSSASPRHRVAKHSCCERKRPAG
jgi:hypothetical protein